VADYAATLAEALRGRFEIVLNPDADCDVELYHLGNNALHRVIYQRALARPGAIVLHDAVLHHFLLGELNERQYIREFVHNYGTWAADQAADLWRNRARSAQDARYFRYPMLRRVAEASRKVIVHNPAAARMVKAHATGADVVEIPHFCEPWGAPDAVEVVRLRQRLGAPESAPLFGVFGYLRESKRLQVILRAFREVRRAHPTATLLIAGRFASAELERAIEGMTAGEGIRRTGYLDADKFRLYAAATDICLNLRSPAAGEASGIAIRMMGLGKATVVTEGEETSRFPDSICVRVDPGPGEQRMLADAMHWLAEDRAARRELGRNAAAWIAGNHSVAECAGRYAAVLESLARVAAG